MHPVPGLLHQPRQIANARALCKLIEAGEAAVFSQHSALFRQGAECSNIFVLATGIVFLTRVLENGDECFITLRFPGDPIQLGIFEAPEWCTATAMTDCQAYRINKRCLIAASKANSDVAALLLDFFNLDLRRLANAVCADRILDPSQRFLRLIRQVASAIGAQKRDGLIQVPMPISDSVLAQMIGVTPRHFGRIQRQVLSSGRIRRLGHLFILPKGTCTDEMFESD